MTAVIALRRFWLLLERSEEPSILNLGCGITAADEGEARIIFEQVVAPEHGHRRILSIIPDVDISSLDAGHVLPNMGSPITRGGWFPLLGR